MKTRTVVTIIAISLFIGCLLLTFVSMGSKLPVGIEKQYIEHKDIIIEEAKQSQNLNEYFETAPLKIDRIYRFDFSDGSIKLVNNPVDLLNPKKGMTITIK